MTILLKNPLDARDRSIQTKKGGSHKNSGCFLEARISAVDSCVELRNFAPCPFSCLLVCLSVCMAPKYAPQSSGPQGLSAVGITILTDSQCLLVCILKKEYDQPSTLTRCLLLTRQPRHSGARSSRWDAGAGVLREEGTHTL